MISWDENSQTICVVGRCYGIHGKSWLKGISKQQDLWWFKFFFYFYFKFLILFVICLNQIVFTTSELAGKKILSCYMSQAFYLFRKSPWAYKWVFIQHTYSYTKVYWKDIRRGFDYKTWHGRGPTAHQNWHLKIFQKKKKTK